MARNFVCQFCEQEFPASNERPGDAVYCPACYLGSIIPEAHDNSADGSVRLVAAQPGMPDPVNETFAALQEFHSDERYSRNRQPVLDTLAEILRRLSVTERVRFVVRLLHEPTEGSSDAAEKTIGETRLGP
jgi:hypothetical protein